LNEPGSGTPRRARGVLLVAGVLVGSLLVGFLARQLTQTPASTLRAVPGPAPAALPAQEPAPIRTVPEHIPEIALPDLGGSVRHLSDWSGKPLVINFWATWCEPCRREIPLLKKLRREHASDGLEIVGIAVDLRDDVRKYAAASGIDYPVLVGEDGGLTAASAFGMDTVLPFSVFADRKGELVALKVGELHRDEAELILDRTRDVDAGILSLVQARAQIAEGLEKTQAARGASGA
jgi:thiol-disulfide isomerase/thioredoxin